MKELSKQQIAELIGLDNPHPVILEIGAYDGKDGKEIAEQFASCEVHCFEADPRSQSLFELLNEPYGKINLHKIALGNVNGEIEFYQSDSETRRHYDFQNDWSASSSIRKPKTHLDLFPDVQFEKKIKVRCLKLDTWYRQNFTSHQLIDFVWADVNGAEEDVILGGINTLTNNARYLYIETSDKELYEGQITTDKLLELLPTFSVLDIYKNLGNFANILLKNNEL